MAHHVHAESCISESPWGPQTSFLMSPVHVVLVSLLLHQLSSLFLIFFGRPKKNCPVSGNFWSISGNFWYTKVPSMWFWSVSWSTKCSVYFSLFSVDQKKIVQSQGIFGQALIIFGPPSFLLVYQNFFLVYQNIRA